MHAIRSVNTDNDNDNDNEYDLLNINFIQQVNNYLASYYKKLEVVYVRETIIKAKTTLVKHNSHLKLVVNLIVFNYFTKYHMSNIYSTKI